MGDNTKIAWCDTTWNPTTGCTRVSSGCDSCYAFALHDRRYAANKDAWPQYGIPPLARKRAPLPFPPQYDVPFSKVQLLPDRLDQPLRWRKPRRIFVDSMSDLFHEDVPDEFISHVFAVASMAPRHTFQILTKRPERMHAYLSEMAADPDAYVWAWAREASNVFLDGAAHPPPVEAWPLPNVWLGVSVEDQQTADERIPLLLQTPAAVRFVSCEPLLAPVDLTLCGNVLPRNVLTGKFDAWGDDGKHFHEDGLALDWVIVGGESGPRHRPMELAWVQSIRGQCRSACVAYFGKQAASGRPGLPLPGELGDKELPQRRAVEGGG